MDPVRSERKSASRRLALPAMALALLVGAAVALEVGCTLETRGPAVAEQARAPDFSLPSHLGNTVGLAELVRNGPAVVIFYRGHW